jgi:CyaY protein
MNPKELEDSAFDRSADAQLRRIEKALSGFDPDEVDAYLGGDVMTITLGNGQKIIVNRHRAARQIWMAALRRAWHFDPTPAGEWRAKDKSGEAEAELIDTLEQVLSQQLGRPIKLSEARGSAS